MVCKNEEQDSNSDYSKEILELIYKDANESLKIFRDDINSINTRLAIVIGFDTNFATFISKLPIHAFFQVPAPSPYTSKHNCYLYSEQILDMCINFINWVFYIKPITGLLVIVSLMSATWGLLPTSNEITIFPDVILSKSIGKSEEGLIEGIINVRSERIRKFENLIDKKASRLRIAIIFLVVATIIAIFIVFSDVVIT
jgi:hypothetical protein